MTEDCSQMEIVGESGDSKIVIQTGALAELGNTAHAAGFGSRVCVVTDSNVGNYHLASTEAVLRAAGFEVESVAVPAGERTKSMEWLMTLWNTFHGYGITRSDFVVALGGGMVGDLVGFAAATYLRGCGIIHVPTSLMAQVDAAIGGKSAINLSFGKNLAGVIRQSAAVVIDPTLLQTLPQRQFAEGMAEVIKYGCIADAELFATVEQQPIRDAQALPLLQQMIQRCVKIKVQKVNEDPWDRGSRRVLNFGHTIGHAIECVMGYGYLPHGEAVAIGMVAAARLGERMGVTPPGIAERIQRTVLACGLPVQSEFTSDLVFEAMRSDKKREGDGIDFVLLTGIGQTKIQPISIQDIRQQLPFILDIA